MRRFLAPFAALMLALPLLAGAATFKAGETLSLPATDAPHEGDVYGAGGTVAVTQDVNGDVMLAGGSVTLTGTVSEDATVAGGDITLVGDVGDDLRAAGGSVTVTGTVGGDLVLAGGFVHVLPDAVVTGDVTIAGGEVLFEGRTEGNVDIATDKVTFSGSAAGDARIRTVELDVTETAEIGGILAYEAPEEGTFAADAAIGGIAYERVDRPSKNRWDANEMNPWTVIAVLLGGLVLLKLVTLLALSLVLVLRFQKTTDGLLADARSSFWIRLVLGLAISIVTPVVMLLLFSTVVGIGFAVIVGLLYAPLCFLGGVLAPVAFGNWLLSFGAKAKRRTHDWKAMLLGYAVLTPLILLLPPVGLLLTFAWHFAVLGTLGRTVWRKLESMS